MFMLAKMADYLSGCPELLDSRVCVNYLAEGDGAVSLQILGDRSSVKEYADGGAMRRATFNLAIRSMFGISQPQNCDIAEKCEKIEKWIEEQNLRGNLPVLDGDLHAVSVGVKKCFEIADTKDFLARYEAQIELIYINQA